MRLDEMMGGLFYQQNTGSDGKAILHSAFGIYSVETDSPDGIELNFTTVNLFQDTNLTVLCQLYNLAVQVRVVDFFGQPISNVNVTLQRQGEVPFSGLTQSDGTAVFNNVTGGDVETSVYLFGQSQPFDEKVFAVTTPTTLSISINKYFVLAGLLVDIGQFTTIIIIIITIIVLLSLELYRRRRSKPEPLAN